MSKVLETVVSGEHKLSLEEAINKGIACMARIESENELINTIADDVEASEGIKATEVKKLIKAAYNDDTDEKIQKLEDLKAKLVELNLA